MSAQLQIVLQLENIDRKTIEQEPPQLIAKLNFLIYQTFPQLIGQQVSLFYVSNSAQTQISDQSVYQEILNAIKSSNSSYMCIIIKKISENQGNNIQSQQLNLGYNIPVNVQGLQSATHAMPQQQTQITSQQHNQFLPQTYNQQPQNTQFTNQVDQIKNEMNTMIEMKMEKLVEIIGNIQGQQKQFNEQAQTEIKDIIQNLNQKVQNFKNVVLQDIGSLQSDNEFMDKIAQKVKDFILDENKLKQCRANAGQYFMKFQNQNQQPQMNMQAKPPLKLNEPPNQVQTQVNYQAQGFNQPPAYNTNLGFNQPGYIQNKEISQPRQTSPISQSYQQNKSQKTQPQIAGQLTINKNDFMGKEGEQIRMMATALNTGTQR